MYIIIISGSSSVLLLCSTLYLTRTLCRVPPADGDPQHQAVLGNTPLLVNITARFKREVGMPGAWLLSMQHPSMWVFPAHACACLQTLQQVLRKEEGGEMEMCRF